MSRPFLICFFGFSFLLFAENPQKITLAIHESRYLPFPKVERVAVGSGKIVSARPAASAGILITGLAVGGTSVTVWSLGKKPETFWVQVTPAALRQTNGNDNSANAVRIQLQLVEASRSFREMVGIHWPEGIQFRGDGSWALGDGASQHWSGAVQIGAADALLSSGRSQAKLISQPELYVRLGEEAIFHSGGELPVSTSSENYGRLHRHVEWKPYGITIRVRPQSLNGYQISSDVKIEISELNQGLSLEGVPAVGKSTVETKVDSKDREAILLSGLSRERQGQEDKETPFFRSLPIVGPLLFSQQSERDEKTEMMIVMTLTLAPSFSGTERIEKLKR